MQSKHRFLIVLVSALLLTMLTFEAKSYNTWYAYPFTWFNPQVRLAIHPDDWNHPNKRKMIEEAIEWFNNNPSKLRFSVEMGALWGHDGMISFTKDQSALGGHPAVTYIELGGLFITSIVKARIYMNADELYTASHLAGALLPYGGLYRPGQSTLMHELGHAAGLGHVSTIYNLMGTDWTHVHRRRGQYSELSVSDDVRCYTGSDVNTGLVALYGADPSSRTDISVVHWKWIGKTGEYSLHGRTVIYDVNNNPMPTPLTHDNESVVILVGGQQYFLEATFENLGLNSQEFESEVYLSTNRKITTDDIRISTDSHYLAGAAQGAVPDTKTLSFSVPNDIRTGYYWIGVIVDPHENIEEDNEHNNFITITKAGIFTRNWE